MNEEEKKKLVEKTIKEIKENWRMIVDDMEDRELSPEDKIKNIALVLIDEWEARISGDIPKSWSINDLKLKSCRIEFLGDDIECEWTLPNNVTVDVEVWGKNLADLNKNEFEKYDKYYNMVYAYYQHQKEIHSRIKNLEKTVEKQKCEMKEKNERIKELEITNEALEKEIREKDEKIKELESKIKELENDLKVQEAYLNVYRKALEKIAEALPPQFVDDP